MPTLHQQIAERFLAKLAEDKDFDGEKIEQIRTLLTSDKRAKADDFVKVFLLPLGGDLK
jgi:hypothetical protein